ncbi:MAG: PAS domain-containing sensor histidine kinase [Chloroflexota bacterium]
MNAVAEDAFRALVTACPVPLMSFDLAGRITSWNSAAERVFGWQATEVLGREHPRQNRQLVAALEDAARGEPVTLELHQENRDGHPLDLSFTLAATRDEAGEVAGTVALVIDLSEQKRVEAEKEALVVAVAHDLKTPLMVIKGMAQMLRRTTRQHGPPGREVLERDLGQIDATAGRITSSLNGLMDVARTQMGRALELECSPMDLVGLVRRVTEEQQASSPRHRLLVETGVPALIGDWDGFRLERVVANLLSNAIKYSPPGSIGIRLAQEHNQWAVLAVRDEGIGIAPQDLPHVFDRFYRGGNVRGLIPGSGMGLAGVRQIVEQHGGTITVRSRQGQGTTFVMRLPLLSTTG